MQSGTSKENTLFTGAHVQRSLGKWNAAYAAVMLRMWQDVKASTTPLNADTWQEVTGLHSIPSDLIALQENEDAKRLGQVAVYARHMNTLGLRSFVELGRRLYAFSLVVPVRQFRETGKQHTFIHTALACIEATGDRAVGVTLAYLLHVLPCTPVAAVVATPVGSLTPPPLSWSPAPKPVTWEVASSLANTPGPRAYWALLKGGKLARLDAHEGVREWSLPLDGVEPRWCVGVTPFRPVSQVLVIFDTGAASIEVLEDGARLLQRVQWDSNDYAPQSDSMSVVANYACWQGARNNLVALGLNTLCIETEAETLSVLADDIVNSHAPGAQMNFMYRDGVVVARLPADQEIVAVTGSLRYMDVFTRSRDWWRLVRLPDDSFHAFVTGLHFDTDIVHVSE